MIAQGDSVAASRKSMRQLPFNSIVGRMLVVLTNGPADQSFLGNPLLPGLIRRVPEAHRRRFVLRLLSISPHYFTEIGSNRYPPSMPMPDVLELELARNVLSRRRLADEVIAPFLDPGSRVLDFGCGIGILASHMADRCAHVTGVDISCGAIACGRVLFPKPNLDFAAVARGQIAGVADQVMDLVTAIAVMQHMDDVALASTLQEIHRVLVPGGRALFHVPLAESSSATPQATQHQNRRNPFTRLLQRRYGLLMLYRDRAQVEAMFRKAGFVTESSGRIGEHAEIDDDIAHQHLFVLKRTLS